MWKDVVAAIFSLIVILLFGSVLYIVLVRPPTFTEGQAAIAQVLLGVLVTAFGGVMNFYIGSSASSQKKDDAINQALMTGTGNGSGTVTVTGTETTNKPGSVTVTSSTKNEPIKATESDGKVSPNIRPV